MRVLVTGGAGFIGSHVVDTLVESGHETVVLDRAEPHHPNTEAEYVLGDIRDEASCGRALCGVDAVSHQAARVGLGLAFGDVVDYVSDNDLGTATLLRTMSAAGFAGRLVLASSMVVYGEGCYSCSRCGVVHPASRRPEDLAAGRFDLVCPACDGEVEVVAAGEDDLLAPWSVYAATKLHQEHLCQTYGRETGNPVIALRYHNVYGPRAPLDTPYAGVATLFLAAMARRETLRVYEDGRQLRDFVHARDVARANLLAIGADRAVTGPFNVASGDRRTLSELARALWEASGRESPQPLVTGEWRHGDVRHICASPERAKRILGFEASTSFEEGMAELAQLGAATAL